MFVWFDLIWLYIKNYFYFLLDSWSTQTKWNILVICGEWTESGEGEWDQSIYNFFGYTYRFFQIINYHVR